MAKFSRREFVKFSAVGAAALAAGGILGCAPAGSAVKEVKMTESAGEEPLAAVVGGEWKAQYCSACHAPYCGTKVRVENGVAMEIKGDPLSPTNEGRLCPRGLSVIGIAYNPYRVQAPMKRTNPDKGLDVDPGWVEITWDEALDTVGARLKEAYEYNPNSFLSHIGFGDEDSRKKLDFESVIGTKNRSTTSGPLCPDHFSSISQSGSKSHGPDLRYAKLLVSFGSTIDGWGVAHLGGRSSLNTADARIDGDMKIIDVNPRKGNLREKDEWVPILPGTDAALVWSIVNVMIHEIGTFDEEYLKTMTNACYLVADKPQDMAGTKVLLEDYARDVDTGKPLVWDEGQSKALPYDSVDGAACALAGEFEVDGEKVKTGFQIVSDYTVDFTPEWAAEITTVPAETIRSIAQQIVDNAHIGETIEVEGRELPYRPVSFDYLRGANSNPLNVEGYKAVNVVRELIGAIDVPGAVRTNPIKPNDAKGYTADDNGLLVPPESEAMRKQILGSDEFKFPPKDLESSSFYPMKLSAIQLVWHALLDPEKYYITYDPKVLMLVGANSFRSNMEPHVVAEAIKKVPFVFSIALWYDEPAQFADVLLAEHSPIERSSFQKGGINVVNQRRAEDEKTYGSYIMFRRPAIEPVYNTMDANDIFIELSERMGLLEALNTQTNESLVGGFIPGDKNKGLAPDYQIDVAQKYTFEDLLERKIKSMYGAESGWGDFGECAVRGFEIDGEKCSTYLHQTLLENNIRIPLYVNRLADNIKTVRKGCEEKNLAFPGADIDEVTRNYSAAPAFYEYEAMLPTSEYPYKVFQFKVNTLVNDQTGLASNQWIWDMQEAYDPKIFKIWVPAKVCADMGLAEDDDIIVESCFGGSVTGKVHVSERIHQQTIGVPGKFGAEGTQVAPFAQSGVCYNKLLDGSEKTIGFPMGNGYNSACIKITKA